LKEINAIGGKTTYNVAAICSPIKMHVVKEAWEKAFEHSECLFIADKSYKKRSKFVYTCTYVAIILHN